MLREVSSGTHNGERRNDGRGNNDTDNPGCTRFNAQYEGNLIRNDAAGAGTLSGDSRNRVTERHTIVAANVFVTYLEL